MPSTQTRLADGAVVLRAPEGYCVDPKSVRDDFVALARCDTLGGRKSGSTGPLALLTVSLAEGPAAGAVESLPNEPDEVLAVDHHDGLVLVQIEGPPPVASLGNTYWRGLGEVGDHVLGLAIYTPKDAPRLGDRGAAMLVETVERTRAASPAVENRTDQPESESQAPRPDKNGLRDMIAGLFG